MKIVIIDYGINNIKSIYSAFKLFNNDVIVSNSLKEIQNAEKLVLPGTGAFGIGMQKLQALNLIEEIKHFALTLKKPIFGVCLGMQLLFEESEEFGLNKGLGIVKGKVVKISQNNEVRLPFIGWSHLFFEKEGRLFKGFETGKEMTYFIHSLKCEPQEEITTAFTNYQGIKICASIEKENIFGCQFHPEKSAEAGLKVIQNFTLI